MKRWQSGRRQYRGSEGERQGEDRMCDLDHAKVKSDCLQDTSHARYDTIRAARFRYV